MSRHDQDSKLALAVEYLEQRLQGKSLPGPAALADNPDIARLGDMLTQVDQVLRAFAAGDFSPEIPEGGSLYQSLRNLQAGYMMATWQLAAAADGDLSKRITLGGDLAASINTLLAQLEEARATSKVKERELLKANASLQKEIARRNNAFQALARSEAAFRYLAEHDPLTGVLNRRSFFELAPMEMARAHKGGVPCCVLMVDVDHFKNFNDTYGHLEGDNALRQVAISSKEVLRQSDIMARFGGEEFVFIFPRTVASQGIKVAERIRKAVEQADMKKGPGEPRRLTVSIGAVEVPPPEEPEDRDVLLMRAVSAADAALYQAKQSGRNRVCVADLNEVCPVTPESSNVCNK